MINYPAAVAAALAGRGGVFVRQLLYLTARDRNTGAQVSVGLWDGDDHRVFTIGGQSRTYYGAGAILGIDALVQQTGLLVRKHTVTVSPMAPAVLKAVREYEPRGGRAEIHSAHFSTETANLLAEPTREFKGYIDGTPISTPAIGGKASCQIVLVSNAVNLTKRVPLKRSDQSQRRRDPNDGIFQYNETAGNVAVVWGEDVAGRDGNSEGKNDVADFFGQ